MPLILPTQVETPTDVVTVIDAILPSRGKDANVYLDLEGNNLGRNGTLSLLQLFLHSEEKVFIVDVTILQEKAFSTPNADGVTLKDILEAEDITKVFFDIRGDSDALFSLFGVSITGAEDVQLMKLALSHYKDRIYLPSLMKCIEWDSSMTADDVLKWKALKKCGRDCCTNGYHVFDKRPLDPVLALYAAQDVTNLPELRNIYKPRLSEIWLSRVEEETKERIRDSQSEDFRTGFRDMRFGPTSWISIDAPEPEPEPEVQPVPEHYPQPSGSVDPKDTTPLYDGWRASMQYDQQEEQEHDNEDGWQRDYEFCNLHIRCLRVWFYCARPWDRPGIYVETCGLW